MFGTVPEGTDKTAGEQIARRPLLLLSYCWDGNGCTSGWQTVPGPGTSRSIR